MHLISQFTQIEKIDARKKYMFYSNLDLQYLQACSKAIVSTEQIYDMWQVVRMNRVNCTSKAPTCLSSTGTNQTPPKSHSLTMDGSRQVELLCCQAVRRFAHLQ